VAVLGPFCPSVFPAGQLPGNQGMLSGCTATSVRRTVDCCRTNRRCYPMGVARYWCLALKSLSLPFAFRPSTAAATQLRGEGRAA
jgi:hypothetical protein